MRSHAQDSKWKRQHRCIATDNNSNQDITHFFFAWLRVASPVVVASLLEEGALVVESPVSSSLSTLSWFDSSSFPTLSWFDSSSLCAAEVVIEVEAVVGVVIGVSPNIIGVSVRFGSRPVGVKNFAGGEAAVVSFEAGDGEKPVNEVMVVFAVVGEEEAITEIDENLLSLTLGEF